MTLVKVVKHVVFNGDVSDYLVENFANRFNAEVCLENEDGEHIAGELVEGYIEDIVIMSEEEADDYEEKFDQIPNQRQYSYMNINRKQLSMSDLIQLNDDFNELYSIAKVNDKLLLCHHETKNCICQNEKLASLEDIENFLSNIYPCYRVLTRIVEKSNN